MSLARVVWLVSWILSAGCFATVTGGGYRLDTAEGRKTGFGLGLHLGIYLDVDPVRVAVGGGGDGALASVDGDRHTMGAKGTSVEAAYSVVRRPHWRGRVTAAMVRGDGYAGYVPGGDDDARVEYEGQCCGRAYFLGATFDVPLRRGSISASLGPSYLQASSTEHGDFDALGLQLRLTLSTFAFLPGLAKIFESYEYKPPHCLEWVEDDRWSNGRGCARYSD